MLIKHRVSEMIRFAIVLAATCLLGIQVQRVEAANYVIWIAAEQEAATTALPTTTHCPARDLVAHSNPELYRKVIPNQLLAPPLDFVGQAAGAVVDRPEAFGIGSVQQFGWYREMASQLAQQLAEQTAADRDDSLLALTIQRLRQFAPRQALMNQVDHTRFRAAAIVGATLDNLDQWLVVASEAMRANTQMLPPPAPTTADRQLVDASAPRARELASVAPEEQTYSDDYAYDDDYPYDDYDYYDEYNYDPYEEQLQDEPRIDSPSTDVDIVSAAVRPLMEGTAEILGSLSLWLGDLSESISAAASSQGPSTATRPTGSTH